MRVLCLYRPNTDHERSVTDLAVELKRRLNAEIELLSVDTSEGDALGRVYGVMQYPAVLAIDSSGHLHKAWMDGNLPLINELTYYLQ
jgi:hypothetical protein